jgi:cation-transporting ATPase E
MTDFAAPATTPPTDTDRGLTSAEVAERVATGRTNDVPDAPVRSTKEIIGANVFTPVNGIIFTLFVLILIAGYPRDALFAGVVISNSVIGVVQEVRARRTLKELELLNAPKATAVRDGNDVELAVSEVVADELLTAGPGDQIVVDGVVVGQVGLEVDESLLTGESDPVEKTAGDPVMSGSFVSTGSVRYVATGVGADSYASKLAEEARVFKLADSELRRGINTILRWLTFIIPPASALLLIRLLNSEETDRWQEALQGTVAAAVAMVPDGLVLLTSLAFIAGVIALARKKALAKELASVELLARVDTICLDKTGTITTGEISYGSATPAAGYGSTQIGDALGAMASSDPSPNPTLAAISSAHTAPTGWEANYVLPFSSARKWAAVSFADHGTWYLGAPEILLPESDAETFDQVRNEADAGKRVLLLAHAGEEIDSELLPADRRAAAVITLEDTVRPDAPEILGYFRSQGVELKVISGDNPATVAAVAERAGIPDAANWIDARTLPPDDDPEFGEIVERTRVFGRVTPHQKRAMVRSLQAHEHVVAMTGDGVNDVLALKDSDMGIAMGAGSAATRAVAQLVLLDNRFATLPTVLDEGRRVINNIERVSNLFITKATYAVLLTLMVGITGSPFPFLPRQLTLIGTFSIGVPGLFLALAANHSLVRPGFLTRVLRFSLPAGIIAGLSAHVAYEIARADDAMTIEVSRTIATVTLLIAGLVVLVVISRPLRPWKVALAAGMGLGYAIVMSVDVLREYFQLEYLERDEWLIVASVSVVTGLLIVVAPKLVERLWPLDGDA